VFGRARCAAVAAEIGETLCRRLDWVLSGILGVPSADVDTRAAHEARRAVWFARAAGWR
jgi:hypothetical protein